MIEIIISFFFYKYMLKYERSGSDNMLLPDYKEAKTRDKRPYKTINFKLDDNYKNMFVGKTYYLKTYGCQMNEHDSENIKAILEELGFSLVEDYEDADLVLLNTCSIRENAHNKAFGMLGRLKHLKEKKKDLIVGLCGCMAQEEGVVDTLLKKYKFVSFVFGTHNIHHLVDLLIENVKTDTSQYEIFSRESDIVEGLPVKRDNPYKAYVNIIYGCDKFCTYCIVPFTRGAQQSRKKDDILKEVKELIKDGYKEVTLLGQNVNAYGKDLEDNVDFGTLLENVAKIGIPRIRFVTSHPWDFTDKMIDLIAKYPNIMPYIHLPLQSGSNNILKLMGRRYTKEEYLTLFKKIKECIPNVAITTDIIVGFPNESVEDFQDTLEVVNACQYDGAFTFIYSPREGTPASKIKDAISFEEKEKRLQKLNEIVNKYSLANNRKYVGKTEKVLVLGESEKDKNKVYGYTETMKLVNIIADKNVIGEIVDVEITDAKSFSLDGVLK